DPAAAAAERVYLFDLPPAQEEDPTYTRAELSAKRPYARVSYYEPMDGAGGQPWRYDRVAVGTYREDGKLMLDIVADVPPTLADDAAAATVDFLNQVGAIMEELLDKGGGDSDFLNVHAVEVFQ